MTSRSLPSTITSKERITYGVLALIAFAYVAARAWMVPLVGDEARTFFLYNEVGRFQPWYAYWDAANHLLCTALAQVSYLCFGPAAWSLRLFSVLSFLVYAWYSWRLGLLILHRAVRWCLWLALLFTPFVIDFFSLYRGYGMSIAFFTAALYHLVRYSADNGWRHFVLVLLAMALATFASLNLLVLWCAVLGVLVLLVFHHRNTRWQRAFRLVMWVLLGVVPLIYLALYGAELNKQGALYVGTTEGIVQGTLGSLCWHLFHIGGSLVIGATALMMAVLIIYSGRAMMTMERSGPVPPVVLFAALLFAEVCGRCILGVGFGVPYPCDRTAIHWVPLMVLLMAFTIDRASVRVPFVQFASLLMLVFPWNMWSRSNFTSAAIWMEEMVPERIYRAAELHQRAAQRPLAIGATYFLHYGWALRNMAERAPLPLLQLVPDSCSSMDLMFLRACDTARFPMYRPLHPRPGDRVMLCERIEPLTLREEVDTIIPSLPQASRSTLFWELGSKRFGASNILIRTELVLASPARPLEPLLVYESGHRGDPHSFYSNVEIAMQREAWNGDTLKAMHWVPMPHGPEAWANTYLLNIRDQPMEIRYCRIRIFSVVPDSELGAR